MHTYTHTHTQPRVIDVSIRGALNECWHHLLFGGGDRRDWTVERIPVQLTLVYFFDLVLNLRWTVPPRVSALCSSESCAAKAAKRMWKFACKPAVYDNQLMKAHAMAATGVWQSWAWFPRVKIQTQCELGWFQCFGSALKTLCGYCVPGQAPRNRYDKLVNILCTQQCSGEELRPLQICRWNQGAAANMAHAWQNEKHHCIEQRSERAIHCRFHHCWQSWEHVFFLLLPIAQTYTFVQCSVGLGINQGFFSILQV